MTARTRYPGLYALVAGAVVATGIAIVVERRDVATPADPAIAIVLAELRDEEGFRADLYQDTLGNWTIGYGTNLSAGISRDEGAWLLGERLRGDVEAFAALWAPYQAAPVEVRAVLADMAYQFGPHGLLRLEQLLGHIERGEWAAAADYAQSGKWEHETPARADHAAAVFRAQAR